MDCNNRSTEEIISSLRSTFAFRWGEHCRHRNECIRSDGDTPQNGREFGQDADRSLESTYPQSRERLKHPSGEPRENGRAAWSTEPARRSRRAGAESYVCSRSSARPHERPDAKCSLERMTVKHWHLAQFRWPTSQPQAAHVDAPQLALCVGPSTSLMAAAFSSNGNLLVAGGLDRTIYMWDVASAVELRRIYGHVGSVRCLSFRASDSAVCSGSEDCTASLWDSRTARNCNGSVVIRSRSTALRARWTELCSYRVAPTARCAVGGRDGHRKMVRPT